MDLKFPKKRQAKSLPTPYRFWLKTKNKIAVDTFNESNVRSHVSLNGPKSSSLPCLQQNERSKVVTWSLETCLYSLYFVKPTSMGASFSYTTRIGATIPILSKLLLNDFGLQKTRDLIISSKNININYSVEWYFWHSGTYEKKNMNRFNFLVGFIKIR